MFNHKMIKLVHTFLILTFSTSICLAGNIQNDLDALGGNKEILKKAKSLDPKNKVSIVQNRMVDRNYRLEIATSYSAISGGDPYISSDNLGLQMDFHFTPRWSIGARYYSFSNNLSKEGERRAQSATLGSEPFFDSDPAKQSSLGVINWYPIYGKLNFFDWAVAQFDIYLLAGLGQIELNSGSSTLQSYGVGIGLWMSQHLSARFEVRNQNYNDQVYNESRSITQTLVSTGIGILF